MKPFTILFVGLIFLGCSQKKDAISSLEQLPNSIFVKDIPKDKYWYDVDKLKEKQLGLKNIESGIDNLEIRLWIYPGLLKRKELYIIRNNKGNWQAEVYNIITERDNESNDSIISKEVRKVIPKLGWESLVDSLLELKIETLPNMHNISGLVDNWDDGVNYNIEFATKHKYRYYSYHVPQEFQDKFWQAKNMTQIAELIKRELVP